MQVMKLVPKIFYFETFKEFNEEFKIGKRDLLVTNNHIYKPYLQPLGLDTNVLLKDEFGKSEPSDEMIDEMAKAASKFDYDRIIACGGGAVIDISKILALDVPEHSVDLFEGAVKPVKKKELIIVPATCGSGSEVTNVSIAELISKGTKKGFAAEETYADCAVLVPQAVEGLPYHAFVTSSIDALIHAIESFLSPKASPYTEMFSLKAIEMILDGYKKIIAEGPEARMADLKSYVLAANYAGIAFGNAGCAAVHALSYSIGGAFHVAHGEANYQFFTEVFKMYDKKNPTGKIVQAKEIFAKALDCDPAGDVFGAVEEFLNKLIAKKQLREYGMVEAQIDSFTESTIENQQRLLGNNYVPLTKEEIREIFSNLY